jgi:hypothetical protein
VAIAPLDGFQPGSKIRFKHSAAQSVVAAAQSGMPFPLTGKLNNCGPQAEKRMTTKGQPKKRAGTATLWLYE